MFTRPSSGFLFCFFRGNVFQLTQFLDETFPLVHRWIFQGSPERSLNVNAKSEFWWTFYIPCLRRPVKIHPRRQRSCHFFFFPKSFHKEKWNSSMLFFPPDSVSQWNFHPLWFCEFAVQRISLHNNGKFFIQ